MTYDKAYFIAKFSAIPDELWCVGDYVRPNGQHCAKGHCGHRDYAPTKEGDAPNQFIQRAGWTTTNVNDGNCPRYRQPTPKARILAALNDLP